MIPWIGAVADDHLYATVMDYVDEQTSKSTAPSDDDRVQEIRTMIEQATNMFDRFCNREEGYWLKSKPLKLEMNGSGHDIIHLPFPILGLRRIEDDGNVLAKSPTGVVPDANGDDLIRFDMKQLDLDLAGFEVGIVDADTGFDLTVYDQNGIERESYSSLVMDEYDQDYFRRVLNKESDYVMGIRVKPDGTPQPGTYAIDGGTDLYGVNVWKKYISMDDYEFSNGLKSVELIGEFGDSFAPPADVTRATVRMADLIDEDKGAQEEEARLHQSQRNESKAKGFTGSSWVDLIIEEYKIQSTDSYVDIR